MDMTGEYRIAAPREKVWAALNDPEILRQSIPGCDEIEKTSDTEFTAKVTAKVGPVKAKFGGKVTLSDIDPPNGYTISGEGSGGAAGFAKGGARVRLAEEDGGTALNYTVQANVGGKLAQIGSRLVDATARKMADEFFGRFAAIVAGAPAEAAEPPAPAEGIVPGETTPSVEAAPHEVEQAIAAEIAAPSVASSGAAAPLSTEPPGPAARPSPPTSAAAEERRGLHPAAWVVGLIIIVAILLWYFT